jgi:hypothetical protein
MPNPVFGCELLVPLVLLNSVRAVRQHSMLLRALFLFSCLLLTAMPAPMAGENLEKSPGPPTHGPIPQSEQRVMCVPDPLGLLRLGSLLRKSVLEQVHRLALAQRHTKNSVPHQPHIHALTQDSARRMQHRRAHYALQHWMLVEPLLYDQAHPKHLNHLIRLHLQRKDTVAA